MFASGPDLLSETNNGHSIQSVSEGLAIVNLIQAVDLTAYEVVE